VRELESLGFRVRVDDSIDARHLYMAGDDDRRAAEVNALLTDPEVRAVLCARGGYGWPRILDRVDWEALRRDPKPLVGFSDATAALAAALEMAGVAAVHGPMVAWDIRKGTAGYDREAFLNLLTRPEPLGLLAPEGVDVLRPGRGEGPLVGGCMTLLCRAVGTPWEPFTDGGLLFLEDWGVKPYQVDHMLHQLRWSGLLDDVRGVVFGRMLECRQQEEDDYTLRDVVMDCLEPVLEPGVPVLYGFPSGHTDLPNLPLPLGVPARIDTEATGPALEVLEPAVAP
jgi:muramoyltetrapeptide carboxypeptidase